MLLLWLGVFLHIFYYKMNNIEGNETLYKQLMEEIEHNHKKRKIKDGVLAFKLLVKVLLISEGCSCGRADGWTMATVLFVCTSVIRSNNRQSEHRFPVFGQKGLFAHSGSCRLYALFSRNTCTASFHGDGVGDGYFYCTKSWNWSKLTAIYHSTLPLKVASFQ